MMLQQTKLFLPVICGPTASGKSALAVEYARRVGGEVVSADSMQIYRDLSVGTARTTEEEMQGVPHHLTGFLPLSDRYSVARYVEQAHGVIANIAARGKQPVVCGGTGLYISSLIGNLQFTPQEHSEEIRRKWREAYDRAGGEALLQKLAAIDPETATRLHPNDAGRIIRALEIWETTGVTMSEQREASTKEETPYDARIILLDAKDRAFLYDRIDRRVDDMLRRGLLDEAKALFGTPDAATAMQAIGYKELFPHLRGEISLDEAVDNLKRSTRRYAKRQLSWFRRMADITLYIDEYDSVGQMLDDIS